MTDKPLTWSNETRKLRDLKPQKDNPRQIRKAQAERLVKSFDEFSQVDAIACNPDGTILNGHQRYHVLLAAYDDPDYEVDVRVPSRALTRKEWQKLTVYLHEGAAGEWNWDGLAEWEGVDVDDLLEWGFDEAALLGGGFELGGDPIPDPGPQLDRADELQEKWQVGRGQVWEIGAHRLMCGDSTCAEDVGKLMGGERGVIVSDPPYGISVDTSWLSALHVQRGKPPNLSDDLLRGDDGTLDLSWLFKSDKWLVFGFPHIARDEPYTGLLIWDKRGDGGERGLGNPVEVAASNAFNGYRLRRRVWAGYVREAGEAREPHPTQKPVGIMADAIEIIGNGDIILDPFTGSGTTGVACERLGRQARMMEIEPKYCAVTLERLTDMGLEPKLLG